MEFDSVTNRYYPSEHVRKLRLSRQRPPQNVLNQERQSGLIRIILSPFDRLITLQYGIRFVDLLPISIIRSSVSICGLPTFEAVQSNRNAVYQFSYPKTPRDWVSVEGVLWFGGDGGVWREGEERAVCGDNDAVHQLDLFEHTLAYCAADCVGIVDLHNDSHYSYSGNGFKSIVFVDQNHIMVSVRNGLVLHFNSKMSKLSETRLDQPVGFQKMVVLEDKCTVLGLSFMGDLYLLDVQTDSVSIIGLLYAKVTQFGTDRQQLVMIRDNDGVFTLFILADPTSPLCTFSTSHICTDIIFESHQFSVLLRESAKQQQFWN